MTTDENLLLTPVAKHYHMEWQDARAAYELHIAELQKLLDTIQGPSISLPSVTLIPPDLPDNEKLIALEGMWKAIRGEAYRLHWESVAQEIAIKKALFTRERPDAQIDKVEDLGRIKERHIQAEWDREQMNLETFEKIETWRAEEIAREEQRHQETLANPIDPLVTLTAWENARHAEQLSRIQQAWGDKGEQREGSEEGRPDNPTPSGGGDQLRELPLPS
jgi:hypothetical protein